MVMHFVGIIMALRMMMMMMMMTVMVVARYHGDREKTEVDAFTVPSMSPWPLSVITREDPGDHGCSNDESENYGNTYNA